MKVRYSDLALAEFDAILAGIKADNPNAAVSFQVRVRRVVALRSCGLLAFLEPANPACSRFGVSLAA